MANTSTSASNEEQLRESREPTFDESKFAKITSSVVKTLWDKIGLRPSEVGLDPSSTRELKSFNFRVNKTGDAEKIVVCLPKNLESFADNWLCIAAVGACIFLDATITCSLDDVKASDLAYRKEAEPYLQGVAAVFKENQKNGHVIAGNFSGGFQQGRMWAVSNNLQYHKHAKLFRLKWNNPYIALTGQNVWNKGLVSGDIQRLVNLLSMASRRLEVRDYADFLKSGQQIINENFKHSYNFMSQAVFSESEIAFMKGQSDELLMEYEKFLRDVKDNPVILLKEDLEYTYKQKAQAICEYDLRVGQNGQCRAKYLFAELNTRKEIKNAKRGFSRDERMAMLGLDRQVICSNPSGLHPKDVFRAIAFPVTKYFDEELVRKTLREHIKKVLPQVVDGAKPLYEAWGAAFHIDAPEYRDHQYDDVDEDINLPPHWKGKGRGQPA